MIILLKINIFNNVGAGLVPAHKHNTKFNMILTSIGKNIDNEIHILEKMVYI